MFLMSLQQYVAMPRNYVKHTFKIEFVGSINANDICCFTPKHTALRSKSKDWLAQNQDVSGKGVAVWVWQHVYLWTVEISLNIQTKRVCQCKIQSEPHRHLVDNLHVLTVILKQCSHCVKHKSFTPTMKQEKLILILSFFLI